MDSQQESKKRHKWWLEEALHCNGCCKASRHERSYWNRKRNLCNSCNRNAVADERVLQAAEEETNLRCRGNSTRRNVEGAFPDNASEVRQVSSPDSPQPPARSPQPLTTAR